MTAASLVRSTEKSKLFVNFAKSLIRGAGYRSALLSLAATRALQRRVFGDCGEDRSRSSSEDMEERHSLIMHRWTWGQMQRALYDGGQFPAEAVTIARYYGAVVIMTNLETRDESCCPAKPSSFLPPNRPTLNLLPAE